MARVLPVAIVALTEAPASKKRPPVIRNGDVIDKATFDEAVAWQMSEDTWRQHQRRLFADGGYDLAYHTHNSERSDAGWPDDVYMHRERKYMIHVESKRQNGKLSAAQVEWLDALAMFRDNMATINRWQARLEVYVTRPLDRDALVCTLFGAQPGVDFMPLHQWCVAPNCAHCQEDRQNAQGGRRETAQSRGIQTQRTAASVARARYGRR